MSDLELNDAVALKTGEDSHEIRRRGFGCREPFFTSTLKARKKKTSCEKAMQDQIARLTCDDQSDASQPPSRHGFAGHSHPGHRRSPEDRPRGPAPREV